MKLCSQCEFIYEDDQELCDMDGAELVYEPTLEQVFPSNEVQAKVELERSIPATSLVALPRPSQTQTLPPDTFLTRRRFQLQIAAGVVLAAITFVAFYAAPPLRGNSTSSRSTVAIQPAKVEPSNLTPAAPKTFLFDTSEDQNAKPEVSKSVAEPDNGNSKTHAEIPALPGLKPLPRLKPLPTLKPIPRLAERRQSLTVSRKPTVIQNANAKKESRFGSLLKKTGRLLKKPFKS